MRSKADISQLNLPHEHWPNEKFQVTVVELCKRIIALKQKKIRDEDLSDTESSLFRYLMNWNSRN